MLRPAKNIVVVKNSGTSTRSNIVAVNSDGSSVPELAEVISIGKGIKPVDFSVGDRITYRRYTDNKIKIDGFEYNFIKFDDILAVIDKKETN